MQPRNPSKPIAIVCLNNVFECIKSQIEIINKNRSNTGDDAEVLHKFIKIQYF